MGLATHIDDMEMITECYLESGKGWACLVLVSLDANTALVTTQAKVDAFMSSLPIGDASSKEVVAMLAKLERALGDKEEQVAAQIEDTKEFFAAHADKLQ